MSLLLGCFTSRRLYFQVALFLGGRSFRVKFHEADPYYYKKREPYLFNRILAIGFLMEYEFLREHGFSEEAADSFVAEHMREFVQNILIWDRDEALSRRKDRSFLKLPPYNQIIDASL